MSELSYSPAAPGPDVEAVPGPAGRPGEFVGRSPGRLAWLRLKRDRTARASAVTLAVAALVALGAPLLERLTGIDPTDKFADRLNDFGMPIGYAGGISADHWLGLEPGSGRDILMQLVYGLRTSLFIAFASALLASGIGVAVGVLAGWARGWLDSVVNWLIDLTLAFPFLIFALAVIPILQDRFYSDREAPSPAFRVALIVATFGLFSWTYTARLVRGQVISLREREFVEAARAAGAGTAHIMLRQLLPNIWAPILVTVSLMVPQFIAIEAALAFVNIGVTEPTPDLGRMIFNSIGYVASDPWYTLFPGLTVFLLVLAFNLLGDALRDSLDPRSTR
ncbi:MULTISPECIES: ABC transporter permease [unclassified Micromonospora]|uniref:ABC transporter permease n=1 Tax=unclassified Micromonospora TaxID=2617518 RepID=UPI0022B70BB5|nr:MULTISPECIES: ABC transporter permease [unclassified Micromonospora]MCZ7475602.1 ABC transporter permease [Micromonospora sp. WMMC273]WBC06210.1 ABC transporter permease [Micromonospora sp. WMMA1976]